MFNFQRLERPPSWLRQQYLSQLVEPQELYLERLVAEGVVWSCKKIAYAIVVEDTCLLEFFIVPAWTNKAEQIFDAMLLCTGVGQILCKSYDQPLLALGMARSLAVKRIGNLFRQISDPTFTAREQWIFRPAVGVDLMMLAEKNDGFFDSEDEILAYANAGGLFVLRVQGRDVGCGLAMPVIAGRGDIDIGMWVMPEYRGRGYATHIIEYLKHHFLMRGMRPICGCDIENTASYRALTSAGFISEHQILEITIEPNK